MDQKRIHKNNECTDGSKRSPGRTWGTHGCYGRATVSNPEGANGSSRNREQTWDPRGGHHCDARPRRSHAAESAKSAATTATATSRVISVSAAATTATAANTHFTSWTATQWESSTRVRLARPWKHFEFCYQYRRAPGSALARGCDSVVQPSFFNLVLQQTGSAGAALGGVCEAPQIQRDGGVLVQRDEPLQQVVHDVRSHFGSSHFGPSS